MRILIAAGGTAGHINPALAIARGIREKYPEAQVHFAGRKAGMEYALVSKEGYPFHPIEVHGIQRKLTPKNIVRNVVALGHLARAGSVAKSIIREVQPDLVLGAGGYVSGPVLRTAAKLGIQTAVHEQNAYPGVTNRLLAKHAGHIFVASEQAVDRLGYPDKTTVVGNPVSPVLFAQDRESVRDALHAGDKIVLLSFGGSLGAQRINEVIADLAAWHLADQEFLHIHATGSIEKVDFARLAQDKKIDNRDGFIYKEYIDDMPAMLAAADLVICRAGALTLAELAAAGKASLLIPSPNVAENHQYYNAMEFSDAGAAVVIEEKELTSEKIIETVDDLTADKTRLEKMGQAALTLAKPDSLERILSTLQKMLGGGGAEEKTQ